MVEEARWDSNSINNYGTVQQIQGQMKHANRSYLCCHPEIRAIIRVLLLEAINKEPKNPNSFAASLFHCNNLQFIVTQINEHFKYVERELARSRYMYYDADALLPEVQSDHSIMSHSSTCSNVTSILRLALVLEKAEKSRALKRRGR